MQSINIGIDNGNGNTKSYHSCKPAGVSKLEAEPYIKTKILIMNGKIYEVGCQKTTIPESKTKTDDMKISILAAIADEMKVRGLQSANIRLGIGTPLTRIGVEKKILVDYMMKNSTYNYMYEGTQYHIHLDSVDVFPQGYSAVVDRLDSFGKDAVIVDIGSWTIDVLPLIEGVPDVSNCKSLALGTITVINDINERLRQKFNGEINEAVIRDIIINGTSDIRNDYLAVIQDSLRKYAVDIMDNLRSLKINTDITNIVFIGGGASVMKHFSNEISPNITEIEDVNINAKGFEIILKQKYQGGNN